MTIWHWRILKWNWFIFEWHWFLFNWQWFVFYRRWFIYNWHLLKFENIYIQIILKYYLNLKTLTFIVNFIDINFELELMIFMINFKLMTFITDFELRKSIINFNDMYIKIITFIFKLTDIHLRLWLQLNLKLMTFVWIHSHLSLMILFSYEKQKCLLPRRCLGWQDFSRRRSRLGPSLRYDIAARSSTDEHRRARLSQFRFLDQRIVPPSPARTEKKNKNADVHKFSRQNDSSLFRNIFTILTSEMNCWKLLGPTKQMPVVSFFDATLPKPACAAIFFTTSFVISPTGKIVLWSADWLICDRKNVWSFSLSTERNNLAPEKMKYDVAHVQFLQNALYPKLPYHLNIKYIMS